MLLESQKLSELDILLEHSSVKFTLPSLHKLLYPGGDPNYERFRSALYASNLNEELAALGYKVQVFESTKKVDSSWYELVALKID